MRISTIKLREIAQLTAVGSGLDKKVLDLLLNKLNNSQLKLFLKFFKKEINQNSLIVKTVIEPEEKIKEKISKAFPGKKIVLKIDKDLGTGIEVKNSDNFLNFNINSIIFETVENIKKNL